MKSEWREYLLGDLYNFSSGLSKNSKEFGFGKPFLSFKTVFNNYILPEELPDLVNSNVDEQERCSIMKGDIFLTRTSENLNELGMSSVALRDYPEATFNGFTKRLRPKGKQIYPLYVAYYMRSPFFRANINSMASMTTRASLNNDILSRLPIQVPTYGEQEKIGDILYSFDKKIKLNHRINENLADQIQTIYCNSYDSIAYKPSGTLADICHYSTDKVPVSDLSVSTYYSTENMQPNKLGAVDAASLPSMSQTTKCHKGDVLISNIRPYFKKIVYATNECGCSTDVLCFSPKENILSAFLFGTLYLDRFFDYMVAGSKGTKMPRGDKQQIMNYPIVIPSKESLTIYNETVLPMLEQIACNRAENKWLTDLRDALMPKLMAGEIDVSAIQL